MKKIEYRVCAGTAMLAVLSVLVGMIVKVDQGADLRLDLKDNAAAASAVATRRATQRNVGFTPEGNATVTAVASTKIEHYLVDKTHRRGLTTGRWSSAEP